MKIFKKNIIVLSLLGGILLISGYLFFQDSLPPRTPHKIARIISGLNIQNNTKVSCFKDDLRGGFGVVPSGDLLIIFTLQDKQLKKLKKECEQKKYQNLPVKNFVYTPDFVKGVGDGLYWLNKSSSDPLDFSLVVLSVTRKKLYIYLSDS